jgi:hypothetical protein
VVDRWQQVKGLLPHAIGDTRSDLELLFGQYSYFLGRLAFNTGDIAHSSAR